MTEVKTTKASEEKEDVIQMIPVNEEKVSMLQKKFDEFQKSLEGKEYAISLKESQLDRFSRYVSDEISWKGKEALGVVEIMKRVRAAKKEGIKSGVYYFTALEIEASHYFLNKFEGKGEKEAKDFISMIKAFEESLSLIREDNQSLEKIKKELAAAQQGIELE